MINKHCEGVNSFEIRRGLAVLSAGTIIRCGNPVTGGGGSRWAGIGGGSFCDDSQYPVLSTARTPGPG